MRYFRCAQICQSIFFDCGRLGYSRLSGEFESFDSVSSYASEFIEIGWLETTTDDRLPGRFEFGMSVDEEGADESGDKLAAFARKLAIIAKVLLQIER